MGFMASGPRNNCSFSSALVEELEKHCYSIHKFSVKQACLPEVIHLKY